LDLEDSYFYVNANTIFRFDNKEVMKIYFNDPEYPGYALMQFGQGTTKILLASVK
jgi:hypothetical protein